MNFTTAGGRDVLKSLYGPDEDKGYEVIYFRLDDQERHVAHLTLLPIAARTRAAELHAHGLGAYVFRLNDGAALRHCDFTW